MRNLRQIDLNLLVALDALLTQRNVSRAGTMLGLSQPVMSRSLGSLRRLFDDPLLVRVGSEYHLTPLASELVGPLRDILQRIEQTVERRLEFEPTTDRRIFTIAASDEASYLILRPLALLLGREAPFVSLHIRPPLGRRTIDQIELGEVDLGLWIDRVRGLHLEREVVLTDRLVYAVAADSPYESLTAEDLADLPRISLFRDPQDLAGLIDPSSLPSMDGASAVGLESGVLRLAFLKGSNSVALTSEKLALEFARDYPIRILEPPVEMAPHVLSMFWHSPSTLDPAHSWLRSQIKAICLEI